jgi:hypothetical protein
MTSGTAVNETIAVEIDDLVSFVIVNSGKHSVKTRVIPAAMNSSSLWTSTQSTQASRG